MKKPQIIISITALLCIVLGSVLMAIVQRDNLAKLPYTIGSAVTPQDQMPMGMMLMPFMVPATEPIPTIDFTITKDSMGDGWTVHALTTNFQFTPEDLGMAPVAGEGHVHLYIDNELIVMLAPWYHIDALSKGPHIIKMSLNNNDHSIYTVNGTQIEATKNILVS